MGVQEQAGRQQKKKSDKKMRKKNNNKETGGRIMEPQSNEEWKNKLKLQKVN